MVMWFIIRTYFLPLVGAISHGLAGCAKDFHSLCSGT